MLDARSEKLDARSEKCWIQDPRYAERRNPCRIGTWFRQHALAWTLRRCPGATIATIGQAIGTLHTPKKLTQMKL